MESLHIVSHFNETYQALDSEIRVIDFMNYISTVVFVTPTP